MIESRIYKALAIVLKRKNYREKDRIITGFTKEYGKIRLIARGVRRINSRRAPFLEIFSQVAIVAHRGKVFDSISEAQGISDFGLLRQDLKKVGIAYLLCELVDALLAEKQEHRDVYGLLLRALNSLNTKGTSRLHQTGRKFALELLWDLGFLPRGHVLRGSILQDFIENITEKRLCSPKLIRQLFNT
ncbi:DNA repair protein RecO [Patescibacteria group bacterium]|nr:DNA repair protein RecO [Patescibacteria group bacterium]MBU1473196.1 DNA repair protein RecO [Patescibacteria group bacterium]MBU2459754.1 DNA repair protein RecO [Patescibacteria group bacterium]MBU2544266.1 DNA repair protein RecO [Patescibacteria group bacterium]